jgi:hypothetical protein
MLSDVTFDLMLAKQCLDVCCEPSVIPSTLIEALTSVSTESKSTTRLYVVRTGFCSYGMGHTYICPELKLLYQSIPNFERMWSDGKNRQISYHSVLRKPLSMCVKYTVPDKFFVSTFFFWFRRLVYRRM